MLQKKVSDQVYDSSSIFLDLTFVSKIVKIFDKWSREGRGAFLKILYLGYNVSGLRLVF